MKSGRIKTCISGSTKHHKGSTNTYSGSKEKYFIQKLFWGRMYSALGGTLEWNGVASSTEAYLAISIELHARKRRQCSALPFLHVFTVYLREGSLNGRRCYIRILPTGSAREKRKPTYRVRIIMFVSYQLSDETIQNNTKSSHMHNYSTHTGTHEHNATWTNRFNYVSENGSMPMLSYLVTPRMIVS